ncbi:MAG: hypothetical protein ACPHCI_01670 [Solirubrobacterales bacterium]
MRKLTDIIRRPSIPNLFKRDQLEVVDYEIHAPGHAALAVISAIYRELDFPRSIKPSNLAHVSGATSERVIFTGIWRSEREAREAFQEIEGVVATLKDTFGPEASIERISRKASRVEIGDLVSDYEAAFAQINPDCVAFTVDIPIDGKAIYDNYCEAMRFPEIMPEGLMLHLAYEDGSTMRTVSVWRTLEDSQNFMRERIVPAGPSVVREHGVFPEVRPIEFKPTLVAFNRPERNIA